MCRSLNISHWQGRFSNDFPYRYALLFLLIQSAGKVYVPKTCVPAMSVERIF